MLLTWVFLKFQTLENNVSEVLISETTVEDFLEGQYQIFREVNMEKLLVYRFVDRYDTSIKKSVRLSLHGIDS